MRKKILVTLLTIALSASMLGCGSSHDSSTDGGSYAVEDTVDTSVLEPAVPGVDVYEEPTILGDTEESSVVETYVVDGSNATDIPDDDPGFGRPPEEDCIDYGEDWDDYEGEQEALNSITTPSGITVLTLYRIRGTTTVAVVVDAIDPNTGVAQNVLSLQFSVLGSNHEYGYYVLEGNQRFGNFQDQFTPDYSKMAITRVASRDHSMHAGWLDKNGAFFDVTAAVGEAETSDFEDPVCYQAIGFTDNGETFVYKKAVDIYNGYAFDTLGYYAVSVDNPQAGSWEMSPSSSYLHDSDDWCWLDEEYRPTDWLDDTHFYVDTGRNVHFPCMLADAGTETLTEFIPGETRLNWSVVASPDGQQVAFMSRSRAGGQVNTVELYTMNLTDQSTKQVTTIYTPSNASSIEIYGKYDGSNVLCTVLDWR